MMRVEVNMDDSIRGLVAKYAKETDQTMPEAYRELMVKGLVISEVEFPTFNPEVGIDDDVLDVADMDKDEYELVLENGG